MHTLCILYAYFSAIDDWVVVLLILRVIKNDEGEH